METGLAAASALIAGGIWAAKQLGVIVTWVVVDGWFRASGIDESEAILALGWADRTVFFPTMYDLVYQDYRGQLDAKGRASLNASVVIATEAATEGSLNYWEATAMELTLQALGEKLLARQAGKSGDASVQLLPAIELQGSPMVVSVGGDGALAGLSKAGGDLRTLFILAAVAAAGWGIWRFMR